MVLLLRSFMIPQKHVSSASRTLREEFKWHIYPVNYLVANQCFEVQDECMGPAFTPQQLLQTPTVPCKEISNPTILLMNINTYSGGVTVN